MNPLEEWLAIVQDTLELPPANTQLILDLARDVAHRVARPAAPLTTFLLGLAAGQSGDSPADVAARIRALLPAAPVSSPDSEGAATVEGVEASRSETGSGSGAGSAAGTGSAAGSGSGQPEP